MKNVLLIALTLIAINCSSQAREEPVKSNAPKTNWLSSTPGTELKKAGTDYFIGISGIVGGFILIGVGSAEQSNVNPTGNSTNTQGDGAIAVGSLALAAGAVYGVLAWVHILRAGKLMDAYKLSFGPTQHGIGLAYKF